MPTHVPVVTTRDEITAEPVPFEHLRGDDAATPAGQAEVTMTGRSGERTHTFRATLSDGVETGREPVSHLVATAAAAEVTSIGTYVELAAPPPGAEAGGCDSNCAEACVSTASDVNFADA